MKQNYSWQKGYLKSLFSFFIVALSLTSTVLAQTYVNGNVGTGATSANGVAAPAGTTWHELQNAGGISNTTLGSGHARAGTADFSVADDFVVPAGATWNLSKLRIYLIDQVTTGTVSPYNDIRVRIYNGTPGAGGTVVYGDMTTNRFSATGYTAKRGIFSTFGSTAAPTPNLPIFWIDANVPVSLAAGTYWVEWQVVAPNASFSITSQVVGIRALPSYNARQATAASTGAPVWTALVDAGQPASPAGIELPFDITYTTTCTPASAPLLSASSLNSCAGQPVTISASGNLGNAGNFSYYTASCGGTLVGTGNSITVSPTVTTTYYVRGDGAGACTPAPGPCSQITITVTPCTCLSPDVTTICEGAIQRLSVTGAGTPGTVTATSGAVTVAIPDGNAAGVTSSIPVTLPVGASITSISVNFNITHTWDADVTANLIAPDGSIFNLVSGRGGSGDNFTNTTVSTASTTSFATGAAPFTGTFAPDYASGVGPSAFLSNVTSFAAFNKNQPSGPQTWRLGLRDVTAFDAGTLTSWTITINYSVLPTAIWTGGTFFTNPAATTPYVVGSESNAVYVNPTTTTTYTATIASGPCAGPNTVTVTVLPRPVLSVSPLTACGPVTLTATGASVYNWTPAAGLSSPTGGSVTANPNVTTTYTVVGTGTNGCSSLPVSATVNAAPTASVISAVAGSTFQINEGFGTVLPAGWSRSNVSTPLGTFDWTQGDGTLFAAQSGAANSYAAASYLATSATVGGTISNWLISPVVNIKNGDILTFWTRTETGGAVFNDGLQARMSLAGSSTNVGSGSGVGDFTVNLVNVGQAAGGSYPETWTKFTATVSGVTGTVQGRIAFRHFVTNAGSGAAGNGDYVGIDAVTFETPSTANCANVVTNIKVDVTGGVGPYTVVYSNGTTNTTIPNYTSGTNIQVSPAATTTYTIVSVTGANGCVGTANSGSAVITITPPASITTQPAAATNVCLNGNGTITVVAGPTTGNTYQWQMSSDGGTTWTNVANAAPYSGATTATLTITGATAPMAGTRYRVVVTGACGAAVNSASSVLNVNNPAVITTQPANASICATPSNAGNTATFTVAATGGNLVYQWQVSTDGGTTFVNAAGASYTGATTNTLTVSNVGATFNNYRYRVLVNASGCTAVTSSAATLTVLPASQVVLSASPSSALVPGQQATLAAAVTPAAGTTYTWYRDGVVVPNATSNTLVVNIDEIGTYRVEVVDSRTCGAVSNSVVITAAANDMLFIYPSPSTGQFSVRYFSEFNQLVYPRLVNMYDVKGARVFSRSFQINSPYTKLDIDASRLPKGIYSVELIDFNGKRIKTGRVVIN